MAAARQSGIPSDRIVLLGTPERAVPNFSGCDLHHLIAYGLSEKANFTERRLEPGEARRKIALLAFSSGTTGKPKVVLSLKKLHDPLTSLPVGSRNTPLRVNSEYNSTIYVPQDK